MRILDLRKKIIVNFSAAAVLLVIFCGIIFYNLQQKENAATEIEKIKAEIAQLKSQAIDLQGKTSEARKYKDTWKNLSENKKNTNGIKMEEVNGNLKTIAEKYNIFNPSIKVTVPETLKEGLFERNTIDVLLTNASLSFEALTDLKALVFVSEFINSLPGYPIITLLEVKRTGKYTNQELVAISSGKGVGVISGKVDFFWYVYKNKEIEKKEEKKPEPEIKPEPLAINQPDL